MNSFRVSAEVDVGAVMIDLDAVEYVALAWTEGAGGGARVAVGVFFEALRGGVGLLGDVATWLGADPVVTVLRRHEVGQLEAGRRGLP